MLAVAQNLTKRGRSGYEIKFINRILNEKPNGVININELSFVMKKYIKGGCFLYLSISMYTD